MRRYAQPADLAPEWLDDEPANAARLIRHASDKVEEVTLLAHYDVDDDGLPSDPRIADAFRRAVCQQVTFWSVNGLDPDKGVTGQAPHLTGQSAGGGSVSYSGAQSTQELGQAATTLCAATLTILGNAGLLSNKVVLAR